MISPLAPEAGVEPATRATTGTWHLGEMFTITPDWAVLPRAFQQALPYHDDCPNGDENVVGNRAHSAGSRRTGRHLRGLALCVVAGRAGASRRVRRRSP